MPEESVRNTVNVICPKYVTFENNMVAFYAADKVVNVAGTAFGGDNRRIQIRDTAYASDAAGFFKPFTSHTTTAKSVIVPSAIKPS